MLPSERGHRIALRALAAGMVGIGLAHFARPDPFIAIVPPSFPAPALLVSVSGFFEILGGVGLLAPALRRWAAWGLIALYVAVFPANIYMALEQVQPVEGVVVPVWAMWARLPLQFVFIGLAYWVARPSAAIR